jgi:ferredoxin
MGFSIDDQNCDGCLACVRNCPASALEYEDKGNRRTLSHNRVQCEQCGQCRRICPREAIGFKHLLTDDRDATVTLDLVRCEICGVPVYTEPYRETLRTLLQETFQDLCPRHRQRSSAMPWSRLGPVKLQGKKK